MIVIDTRDSLRCITQGDHAHFAADLLSLCRFPELLNHPHREALIEAVREHDNGWRELDAAPQVDPKTATLYDYVTLPGNERRRLWARAARRQRDDNPTVALLITQHALSLHQELKGTEVWDKWLSEILELRAELLVEADLNLDQLNRDYAYLRFADRCSLAACDRGKTAFADLGTSVSFTSGTLILDPLPLVGATSFNLRCRHLPKRRYLGDLDLGTELATARWETFTVQVAAPVD
jgi:hypothetical protein